MKCFCGSCILALGNRSVSEVNNIETMTKRKDEETDCPSCSKRETSDSGYMFCMDDYLEDPRIRQIRILAVSEIAAVAAPRSLRHSTIIQ